MQGDRLERKGTEVESTGVVNHGSKLFWHEMEIEPFVSNYELSLSLSSIALGNFRSFRSTYLTVSELQLWSTRVESSAKSMDARNKMKIFISAVILWINKVQENVNEKNVKHGGKTCDAMWWKNVKKTQEIWQEISRIILFFTNHFDELSRKIL